MHKMKYLIISVLFLTAGVSFGVTATWINGSGDGFWNNSANWVDGAKPLIGDSVHIGVWPYNVIGPVINTVDAKGFWIAVGIDYESSLDVTTGGILDATHLSVGHCATAVGVMNMSGGQVNIGNSFLVGGTGDKTTVSGIFNMSGGVMTIGSYFNIGNGAGGCGTVNLSGGTINSPDIWMRDSTDAHPKLNLAGGKVVLPIGMKSRVETYVANGWITGYGSNENVVITEIESGTKVEVTASLDTCEDIINAGLKLNSDLNGDCVVNFKDFSILSEEWLTESEYGAQPFFDVAVPQGTITVDGVISSGEWDGATWNIMDQPYDGTVDDVTEAKWTAKWNSSLNLLYVVVTVTDTHPVLVNSYTDWYTNDSVEIYVDFPNAGTLGYNSDYAYSQHYIGGISNVVGNEWLVLGANYPLPSGAVVAYQALKSGSQLTYEIALRPYSYLDINVPANSVVKTLVKGDVMGLDVVIGSNNGSSFGMLTGKVNIAGKFYNATAFMKAKLVQ